MCGVLYLSLQGLGGQFFLANMRQGRGFEAVVRKSIKKIVRQYKRHVRGMVLQPIYQQLLKGVYDLLFYQLLLKGCYDTMFTNYH